jgi:hypothetical protein
MEVGLTGIICEAHHQALHVQRHARQTAHVDLVRSECLGSPAADAGAGAAAITAVLFITGAASTAVSGMLRVVYILTDIARVIGCRSIEIFIV